MSRKTIKILGLTIFTIVLTYFGYVKLKEFFNVDVCLDRGGRWDYEKNECDLGTEQTTDISTSSEWIFDKVENSKLIFKNGQTFETNLFELEFIGQVSAERKAPYLIFSGRECDGCDANISIYIHSPSDGKLEVEDGQNRYQYSGTEKDYLTDSVLYISRAFYGQVLENLKGVIWYEKRLLENGEMGQFVYLVELGDKKTDTNYIDNGKLDETINLLKKGLCKEINGRQYSSEP